MNDGTPRPLGGHMTEDQQQPAAASVTRTMTDCPSHFALDDRDLHGRLDDGDRASLDRHIAGCARCQARRAERAAALAEFRDAFAAPVWAGVLARRREPTRRSLWSRIGLALIPAVAVAGAAALLLARPATAPAPAPSYLAAKGQARAPVEIICRRGERAFLLAPDDGVAPSDELRFRPLPVWADARFIQIGSVDGTGVYSPFYPPAGSAGAGDAATSVALPARGDALGGSIRLDDAPGPERLFVVLSAVPLTVAEVRRAAEASTTAAGQNAPAQIGGTPVISAWIVLDKVGGASGQR